VIDYFFGVINWAMKPHFFIKKLNSIKLARQATALV
jgi:hypothetical protein